ncbi:F-box/LRR-repeat protein 17-like [Hibiscus syriacus]|uniref:F-box/LRR-repeat protein 17-like n=1 Tax=Hibiscus syriacus TaxID=106335 RepID=UPI001923148A|nr:F-box/LRR-repeat protein 17-like [Hibiscus syriacus]
MHCPRPHVSSPSVLAAAAVSAAFDLKPAKRRGSCGLPKKGHFCQTISRTISTIPCMSMHGSTPGTAAQICNTVTLNTHQPRLQPSKLPHPHSARQPYSHLRRSLDFDDIGILCYSSDLDIDGYDNTFPDRDLDLDSEIIPGGLPFGCMWEILRRLPPAGMLAAGSVCKGWRETTKRLWRVEEELRLFVPPKARLRFIRSVLQKCPSLTELSLKVERDLEATMLACIAFSCPNMESIEISTSDAAVNRITGYKFLHFLAFS